MRCNALVLLSLLESGFQMPSSRYAGSRAIFWLDCHWLFLTIFDTRKSNLPNMCHIFLRIRFQIVPSLESLWRSISVYPMVTDRSTDDISMFWKLLHFRYKQTVTRRLGLRGAFASLTDFYIGFDPDGLNFKVIFRSYHFDIFLTCSHLHVIDLFFRSIFCCDL